MFSNFYSFIFATFEFSFASTLDLVRSSFFFLLVKISALTAQSRILTALGRKALENTMGEGEMLVTRFSAFPTIFPIPFNPFSNKPWFLRVCSTSLLKTLWEKEKLLVTSNFSFSHSVFYLFGYFFRHFHQI